MDEKSLKKSINEWLAKREKEPRTWGDTGTLSYQVWQDFLKEDQQTKKFYFEKGARWAADINPNSQSEFEVLLSEEKAAL